jgi:hypothetical protein
MNSSRLPACPDHPPCVTGSVPGIASGWYSVSSDRVSESYRLQDCGVKAIRPKQQGNRVNESVTKG